MSKYIAVAAGALLLLAACNNTTPQAQEKPAEHAATPHLIHLDSGQIRRAGIAWGVAEKRAVATVLPLTGELRIHPENRATVSATADGLLTDMRVRLNQSVRKGEIIGTLRKSDLLDLQQQFLENRDRLAFLQTERDRYAALKNDDATAAKNLQKSEAELRAATTTGQVLAAKLRLYKIDPDQLTAASVRAELPVYAPINGIVTAVHLSAGSAVQSGAAICEIADFSALHADLFVYEKDILKIRTGQRAVIAFPGAPASALQAEVFSIDRVLDPAKNALRVHARVNQTAALPLTDGLYFDAALTIDAPASLPTLPADAVVRDGLEEFVLVLEAEKNGGAAFRAVQVTSRETKDGYTAFEPATALPEGARLVRKGAYFVWSQGKVEEFAEEE
jgi:cobalt-zinc-cadmium efflux system membrane fusion protein